MSEVPLEGVLDTDGSVLDTCGGVSDTDIKGSIEVLTVKGFNHASNSPTALFFKVPFGTCLGGVLDTHKGVLDVRTVSGRAHLGREQKSFM